MHCTASLSCSYVITLDTVAGDLSTRIRARRARRARQWARADPRGFWLSALLHRWEKPSSFLEAGHNSPDRAASETILSDDTFDKLQETTVEGYTLFFPQCRLLESSKELGRPSASAREIEKSSRSTRDRTQREEGYSKKSRRIQRKPSCS